MLRGTDNENDAARVGGRVGRWRLDALVGSGGMAAVYAATHDDGKRAALKILHVELARDHELRERFIREGEIARSVEHPGCVRIVDDDVSEEGEPYLVMELLEGKTLDELWRERDRRLPHDWILHVAARILDVLRALHEVSIVHRDIKPSNVFILRDGSVKLLDFGIAQLREVGREQTRAGLALGTPAYMAPEQAQSRLDEVDARSDIYALGATLYTLLSGERLHKANNEQEAYVLAATQPAPSLARLTPHLPVPVIAIVDKALQWDRRNRFQSASEMREAVAKYLWRASNARSALPKTDDEAAGPRIELTSEPPAAASIRRAAAVGTPVEVHAITPPSLPRAVAPVPEPQAAALRKPLPGAATEELPLDPNHPLSPFFVHLDRLLRTARQYGPAHPETHGRLAPVVETVRGLLQTHPRIVRFTVQPFCFSHDDAIAWEPAPPGDLVPYTLSVAGLRELQIRPGAEEAELRELFGMLMIDANTRPSDVATALWEASLPHVECRLEEEIASGDAQALDELFQQTADIEDDLRSQLSALQKLAASMDRADVMEAGAAAAFTRHVETTAAMLTPSVEEVGALVADLSLDDEEEAERHAAVLVDAFVDVLDRDDPQALTESVTAYSLRLVQLGRYDELFLDHRRLVERAAGSGIDASVISAAMFPNSVVLHLVRMASAWRDALAGEELKRIGDGLRQVLGTFGPDRMAFFAGLVNRIDSELVREVIIEYLVRVSEGHEQELMQELQTLDPLVTQRVLKEVLQRGGPSVRALLESHRKSANSALRCEAIAQLASSHVELTQELIELFKSDDQSVRWAALETFIRHGVRSAGPTLVRLVEHDSFKTRSLDEQQKVFEALRALNPPRTEALLNEVVVKHGLVADEALDQTRALAARLLGEWGDSEDALDAAREATSRRWWNTAPLREVARQAATAIEARLATKGGTS